MSKFLRLACVAVAAALMSSTATAQTLYGYARNYTSTGMVKIDVTNTAGAQLYASDVQPTAGAVKDETMYVTGFNENFDMLFYSVDLTTGATTKIATLPEDAGSPMDMSFNYNDEKMYFVNNSDNEDEPTSKLCTIDLTTGKSTVVKRDLGFFVRAMAISTDGVMYYVTRDGELNTYVISTGKKAVVGNTGVNPRGTFSSMGFDRKANKLYWATETKTSYVNNLYEINTNTGAATLKGVIGNANNGEGYWTVALDAAFSAADNAAPNRVSEITATPDATGALKVALKWTNPTTMVNDAELTSLTKVVVSRGDDEVASLTNTTPGQEVEWTDEAVPAAGMYRYHVVAYNEEGASADRFVDVFVGHDVPGPVLLPLADLYGANKVANVLTWHAPAEGKNGGYMDAASLRYDIIRLNDNVKLADNQEFTPDSKGMMKYTDEDLETLQRYEYAIVARNNDGEGDATPTNFLVNGPAAKIQNTYTADFNKEADAMLWTPFNANGDYSEFEWHWYSALKNADGSYGGNVYVYQAHESNYANDYLVSPPMEFTEGHSYTIKVMVANSFAPYPEAFTIFTMGGNAPHGALVGVALTDPISVNHPDQLQEYTFNLSKIADDGVGTDHDTFASFLAVACESNPAQRMFLVGKFTIIDNDADPSIVGDVNGDGKVDVTDVNLAINVMLGKATKDQYPAADVNGDGTVDVTDVNQIINIMLGR